MGRLPEGTTLTPEMCTSSVKEFLSGRLITRPEVDLNVYHVALLNEDATLSVVDPSFGSGNTKPVARVSLQSPGEDWALTADQSRLFVTLPDSDRLAVVDTSSWRIVANVAMGPRPTRAQLQPDGHYVWVSVDQAGESAGLAALSTTTLQVAATVHTGRGPHDVAFTPDSGFAFVSNTDQGTVSVIDVRALKKVADIQAGRPVSVAASPLGRVAYVVDQEGAILVLEPGRSEPIARIPAEAGVERVQFAPGGRVAFVTNPARDVVHIIDAASSRIVQTASVDRQPDRITFTNKVAHVGHRGSELVLMIPLDRTGGPANTVQVAEFTGGQHPLGAGSRKSLAGGIIQVPGEDAVLVANPADRAVYFYKEGMAAPMGSFSTGAREPRAILAIDRRLKQQAPGRFETTAVLRRPGQYVVAFFLDSPRIVRCFQARVDLNLERSHTRDGQPLIVRAVDTSKVVEVGDRTRLRFRLADAATGASRSGLDDVRVLTYLVPGLWQNRQMAESGADGLYEVEFAPTAPGLYNVHVECPSAGLSLGGPAHFAVEVTPKTN
jgi:DNA-binding beta-propeller fold protein YncE